MGILDRNAHALGLVIALTISAILLLGRLIWRPAERRDIGLLFLATAVALTPAIAVAFAINVNGVVITSSRFWIPSIERVVFKDTVPLVNKTQYFL